MDYQFLWRPVFQALPEMLSAAWITLEVSILSMLVGTFLGLFLYFFRSSALWSVRFFAGMWIELARNTPALFQLFFFKFGLGAFGIFIESYFVVFIALAFNTAGYMAENFKGGFNAVPPTQLRAARSLGMTFFQTQLYIIVPQVMRIIYHPMTNQFIWVILMSSLGMLVGLRELTGETQFLSSKTFRTFEFFAATAVIYYIIAKIALGLMSFIGWRLFKGPQ